MSTLVRSQTSYLNLRVSNTHLLCIRHTVVFFNDGKFAERERKTSRLEHYRTTHKMCVLHFCNPAKEKKRIEFP